jgi:MarR family transcriptional regulator for hemolysin
MELDERFAEALHGSARAWRLAVDRRLKGLGLSQASWMAIAVAARARAPLSQSEIANRLGVEGATMVAMIDRLVKAGLVSRQISPTDRRVRRVLLTEAGNRIYDTVKAVAAGVRKDLLVHTNTRQLAAVTELLETLQQVLEGTP